MAGEGVSQISRYAAEYLGTFLLVFTVCCNVYTGSGAWAATSIACVLMVSIYACAPISGANFNPAVTLALAIKQQLAKKPQWKEAGIYCAVQLLGGLTAGLICTPLGSTHIGPKVEGTVEIRWYQCALAEMLFTCMLCFVVLNVTAKKNEGVQFFGLAIGFVIVAGGYAVGGISGGCFNPAVALGVGFRDYYWFPVYWLAELAGGAIAAGLFRVCRPDDFGVPLLSNADYPIRCKAISELLGTFFLVLTVELNATQGSVATVWSIAASLMCMIFALGNCSGAHFNPAVTVSILVSGRNKVDPKTAGIFMGSQVTGGVLGALVGALLMRGSVTSLGPGDGFSWTQASAAELIFTLVLCFTVLSVATLTKEELFLSQYFGLAIASCVTVGGLAIGKISGGSLNPAVSIGISTAELLDGGRFWQCIPYTISELLGGILAAAIFFGTRPSEYGKTLPLSETCIEQ